MRFALDHEEVLILIVLAGSADVLQKVDNGARCARCVAHRWDTVSPY